MHASGTSLGRTNVVLHGIAAKVFNDRYSLKTTDGQQVEETPEQMWWRVAGGIAKVEEQYIEGSYDYKAAVIEGYANAFYKVLEDFKFVPGGRILMGAGTGFNTTFFNCYVIEPPEDSRGGILDNIKWLTEVMARGGGVGVNLSTLRPKGSHLKSLSATAGGPVPWAELYSTVSKEVIHQGGSRKGALMIMLDDDHPDIIEFIRSKRIDSRTNQPEKLQGANISVAISDAFMDAVREDGDWTLQFPTKANAQPDDEVKIHGTIRAADLWDAICQQAWETADPGMVFMDRYNKESNTWYYENIRCVNPCGEQGLPSWGVCNLGAMNLSAYAIGPIGAGEFQFKELAEDVKTSMRFLDNVVDANLYFLEENQRQQTGTRRTGLGTMGLADALIKMGVRYGSEESLYLIDTIYSVIRNSAYEASVDLAKEKGSFPFFDAEKYVQGKFIKTLPEDIQRDIAKHGIRNAVLLTQAPTGTTSLLAGASSGIEPNYAFRTRHTSGLGVSIVEHPLVQGYKSRFLTPTILPDYFVSADELSPEEHINVQARIQQYTDSSISKTVNGPNGQTVHDVKRLYRLAYDLGCKGITYYRDGSRDAVLERVDEESTSEPQMAVEPRPSVLFGYTRNLKSPEGTLNITVNSTEQGPVEVFLNVGRAGSDVAALAEAMGRLISLTLRVPSTMSQQDRLDEVVAQLHGIGGSRFVGYGPEQVKSLPDAISKALAAHRGVGGPNVTANVPFSVTVSGTTEAFRHAGSYCPECGNGLTFEEGCKKCYSCGYSEC